MKSIISQPCMVCGALSALKYNIAEAKLYRCPICDHCFTDVKSISLPDNYRTEYYTETHRNWFANPNYPLLKRIHQTIERHKTNASVIDIGCGRLDLLKYLREKNPCFSLVGIDIAPNKSVDGIEFIQGDALATNIKRRFDVVTSLAFIEHIWDVRAFAKRLKELCVPGGIVIIMTVNDRSLLFKIARLLYRFGFVIPFERLYSVHHLNHFNTSSLTRLMTDTGLTVVKIFHHNVPFAAVDFPHSSALISSVYRIGLYGIFLLSRFLGRGYLLTAICYR